MHDETLRLGLSEPPNAFLRSCPVGVKSCFGAFGFYDYRDTDPENDLSECLCLEKGGIRLPIFSVYNVM